MYSKALHNVAVAANYHLHQVCFDSDSFLIGLDNNCLATMSHNKDHFKDFKFRQIRECTGIGTGLMTAGKGTVSMNIEDDDGRIDKM